MIFTIKNFNKNFIMKDYNSHDEIINHITKGNQTQREEVFTFHLLCSFQRSSTNMEGDFYNHLRLSLHVRH